MQFITARSVRKLTSYKVKDTLSLPMLDSVDAWSRRYRSISEYRQCSRLNLLMAGKVHVIGQEEGYSTGDNVFVDYTVEKVDLQPNEFGELSQWCNVH